MLLQAELKKSGWSDAVLESLRYLFASEQELEQGSALDPLQWFQALFKYREIPNVMTAWKQELSEKTEQQVFQVSYPTCFVWVQNLNFQPGESRYMLSFQLRTQFRTLTAVQVRAQFLL